MKKEKYSVEFVLGNASQKSLWRMLTDPIAMEEWFADKVKLEDGNFYTFIWGKNAQQAEVVIKKPIDQVRYSWLATDKNDVYFEFKIHKLELSRVIALEITDFALAEDIDDAIFLWENQIDLLKRKLGI